MTTALRPSELVLPASVECPSCHQVYDKDFRYDAEMGTMALMEKFPKVAWVVVWVTCCKTIAYAKNAPVGLRYEECPCGRSEPHPLLQVNVEATW